MLGEIFWNTAPYVTLAIVFVGTWWRYRYDKFGWTTRSSQLYESRLLRIGSPMFHFGILVVIVGHVIGLVIPESWTAAIGMSEHAYHVQAVTLGTIAGITTLAGAALLIYRRRTRGPVFMATTVNDKVMYVVLVLAIVLGLYATALGSGVVRAVAVQPIGARVQRADRLSFPAIHRVPQPGGRGQGRTCGVAPTAPRLVTPPRAAVGPAAPRRGG